MGDEARLAGRLSRALVGWHPRRWRERYRSEMLEVLDQHHPTVRTVASLGGQTVLWNVADPRHPHAYRITFSRQTVPGQVRGAYSIESNGQSRSSHARTAW